jgi:tetratricopeptide (TPR) repeat protein
MWRLTEFGPVTLLLLMMAVFAACSSKVSTNTYLARQNAGDEAFKKGNYSEAEKQYKANLEDAENYGPQDQIPTAFHYLADVYIAQQRYAEVEKAYQQEVSSAEKVWGEGSPETLHALTDIALFYVEQNRSADAEKYNRRALAIGEKGVGKDYESSVELAKTIDGIIQDNTNSKPVNDKE